MGRNLLTSESVLAGHPDKVCDQISDAILNEYLLHDPYSRVACEACISKDTVFIGGEITSNYSADIPFIARNVLRDIGYDSFEKGFDYNHCSVIEKVSSQSKDISNGVENSIESRDGSKGELNITGAGDQGMVFGYACNETDELMPLPLVLAHNLAKRVDSCRYNNEMDYLLPDGKTQVTVEYIDGKPKKIDSVVVSAQHRATVLPVQIYKDILSKVIFKVMPDELIDSDTKVFVNPTGKFVSGGPMADTGLTGRKIIVDTYGGFARHGGGAFSGKDATKVDRSGSYMARYIAKNLVAAGIAKKCEVQIAYVIGKSKPTAVNVDTFGTSRYLDSDIITIINSCFDLRTEAIIQTLKLRNPIYKKLAVYGHMGREDLMVPWEEVNMIDNITACVNPTVIKPIRCAV